MKPIVKKKRRFSDGILNGITYLSSGLSVVILLALFIFIFSKGSSLISFDLLTSDYWSKNYLTTMQEQVNKPGNFQRPSELGDQVSFSQKWGVGFVDSVNRNKEKLVLIEYIDENSPFLSLLDASIKDKEVNFNAEIGLQVEKIDYKLADGTTKIGGNLLSQNAQELVDVLDHDATTISSMYFKTPGGGIQGSIITTFYLIIVSLLIALPIGIAAAIYLHEYAKGGKINSWIRSGIETLTGVPSIVFGLMGVSVLFPITTLFGATTTNILLGALTMAIILLPTIIRSTEEALIVVPQSLRDASLSVGANQSQTIFKVVLPCAIPGIMTGVLLSIGRVVGESAALIYTMGSFINDSPTLTTQGTSLAVHIWSIMSGEQPNFELASAISIVILIFVLILNFTLKFLSRRFNKAWY